MGNIIRSQPFFSTNSNPPSERLTKNRTNLVDASFPKYTAHKVGTKRAPIETSAHSQK
jgi:hypothetical protein